MNYAIETFSLTKVFSDWWGRNKVLAVDDLNLQMKENEVFGLLGPNGSGKTTTIKMLLGLLHPTKGKALVLGGDGTDSDISSRVGFLPEESYLYRYLTARETLDFYARLFGLPSRIRKERIEALLDMVGLLGVANRPVGTFSKGMARRIGLAQALINDPDLLILDEPTTGLDPIGTRQIKDLIIQLAKRGKAVLLCSHLLADVEDICDRIAILYGGKIQTQGKVSELLEQTDKLQITTSAISDQAIEKIKSVVAEENAECEVTSPTDKLETFFIRTVVAAQQEDRTTSGAISTTDIGDFLSAETKTNENILDKLVSAGVDAEQSLSADVGTEAVTTASETEPGADEDMLDKLTSASNADELVTTEPVQPEPVQEDKPNLDVLDQLTGRNRPIEKENDSSDGQGAKGNA
jgi:ABC-2 type transport system ATP-binding protein